MKSSVRMRSKRLASQQLTENFSSVQVRCSFNEPTLADTPSVLSSLELKD